MSKTITRSLTEGLVDHLSENVPDETIVVVDARRRGSVELPTIAVSVESTEPFNEALHMVQNLEVEMVLRTHVGDDDGVAVDSWVDQIESNLNDVSVVLTAINTGELRAYDWTYEGSTQEWDESVIETSFKANAICSRI